ncbi:MAG TPA: electron transport complex subunit RsxC [Bacteroidales bacterium]|jgi:electron transport complex protein RnfC|nr:electron transport complex subunit RsxC [Bacteroidales bacterium]HQA86668.1 electron transport complex subunit RsxC [Bacteroidales bacterium]
MKTFKIGGIHPEENKLAKEEAIEVFPIPKQVTLFVTQHLGAPSTPIVQAGDKVKVGQLVATAQTLVCANLHSPVSGTVVKVDPVPDMTGYRKLAITIDVEDDIWEETIDTTSEIRKEITLTKPEIIERIKACGVVGLGGACFPTHVKYMIPPEKKVDYIIINGAECEPYITTDHRIMLENGEECLIGVQALLIASGAPEARIGIEANKPDAFEHLQRLASQYPNIKVFKLKTKYPQGAEKQLIKSLTGREVPNGKLPIEVGCIVNNITTTYAIYEAVQKNKPLIETYTTISGKGAKTLKNYKIRLGTSISEVLSTVGIPENTGKIVSGGPMMGKAIANINSYFVKGMSSLLFIDESESKRGVVEECIRCGKCVTACPMGLEPYLLYALATRADYEECEKHGIMNCIECGSCQYGCPAFRPLLDMIRVGKNKTGYMIRTRNK